MGKRNRHRKQNCLCDNNADMEARLESLEKKNTLNRMNIARLNQIFGLSEITRTTQYSQPLAAAQNPFAGQEQLLQNMYAAPPHPNVFASQAAAQNVMAAQSFALKSQQQLAAAEKIYATSQPQQAQAAQNLFAGVQQLLAAAQVAAAKSQQQAALNIYPTQPQNQLAAAENLQAQAAGHAFAAQQQLLATTGQLLTEVKREVDQPQKNLINLMEVIDLDADEIDEFTK